MVADALEAVQRNLKAFILYASITAAFTLAVILSQRFVLDGQEGAMAGAYSSIYAIVLDILNAGITALAQCLAFSRIGRDMDKPIWKVDGDLEVLRRFYVLWFLINLALLAGLSLISLAQTSTSDASLVFSMFLVWLLMAAFTVPLGASIMFCQKAGREEFVRASNTLADQARRTFPLILFAFCIYFVIYTLAGSGPLPSWARLFLVIVECYANCAIFAGTWIICMTHRDEDSDFSDFDF